uniref:Uncharacterized protein n=1 Tax=Arundo donax TaxID=35708 RepID=A0A0A8YU43_ARUDO
MISSGFKNSLVLPILFPSSDTRSTGERISTSATASTVSSGTVSGFTEASSPRWDFIREKAHIKAKLTKPSSLCSTVSRRNLSRGRLLSLK